LTGFLFGFDSNISYAKRFNIGAIDNSINTIVDGSIVGIAQSHRDGEISFLVDNFRKIIF